MTRIVHVPAGIGDNIWIAQKLLHTSEKFKFLLPAGIPQRGKAIFDLLPQITQCAQYNKVTSYNYIRDHNIQKRFPQWKGIVSSRISTLMLEVNTWLENGNRIEDFFPDLPTSFKIDFVTSEQDRKTASDFINSNKHSYVGIYATSYSTARAWGFWNYNEWVDLIKLIYKKDPSTVFVIIGASWDTDMGYSMMNLLDQCRIPYISTIGTPLGGTVEILKLLDYFIGFPSGLSIINEMLQCNGLMFYPPHLEKMMYTWADKERLKDESHKPMQFCTPDKAFDWLKTEVFV
jgi:ADP-heptose:LPS heptosyltransferase